jgi:hypothetical protein
MGLGLFFTLPYACLPRTPASLENETSCLKRLRGSAVIITVRSYSGRWRRKEAKFCQRPAGKSGSSNFLEFVQILSLALFSERL